MKKDLRIVVSPAGRAWEWTVVCSDGVPAGRVLRASGYAVTREQAEEAARQAMLAVR